MTKNVKPEKPQKPKVIIDLPPILEAYCRFVFKTPEDSDIIKVTRSHSIGRAVNGLKSLADAKPVLWKFKNPVTFTVPETKLNWYKLQTKYIYFSSEDTKTFIDRVHTSFDHFCEMSFRYGYAMKFEQKEIAELITDILNVRANAANMEAIIKNDYRLRKKEINIRSKALLKERLLVC